MSKLIPKILENSVNVLYSNGLRKQRKIRKLSLSEIEKIQWKRLKDLLEFVYDNNIFYKEYFNSVQLKPADINQPVDLLQLPITEKRTYRKDFHKIMTKGVDLKEHILSCTSGSSGEPFKFYNDKEMVKKTLYFSYLLNKESMGIQPFEKLNELEIKPNPRNEINIITGNSKKKNFKNFIKDFFISEIFGLRCEDVQLKNINNIVKH